LAADDPRHRNGDVARRVGRTLPDGVEEVAWVDGSEKLAVAVQDAGSHAWFLLDVDTDTLESVHAGPNAYGLTVSADGTRAAVLHASLVQPPEVYAYDVPKKSTRRLTTHTKDAVGARTMPTRDQMTWKGARGDTVHGFRVLPPASRRRRSTRRSSSSTADLRARGWTAGRRVGIRRSTRRRAMWSFVRILADRPDTVPTSANRSAATGAVPSSKI
jgi:hypothetical protein